jgi:hypothetical protein
MLHMGDRAFWFTGDVGSVHRVRCDVEAMAVTPTLAVGDLLLLRGDTVHRTQDADTERVAVSFRITCSSAVLERRRLVAGGQIKAMLMANNAPVYERMFAAFDGAGRKAMRIDEMQAALATMGQTAHRDKKAFFRFLMAEKLRAGLLPAYVYHASLSASLTWCARGLAMYQQRKSRAEQRRKAIDQPDSGVGQQTVQ